MIQKILAEDLKKMQDREGLVLQGCGGDLREWEDGIHQMLAEEKILQNGAHFKELYAFEHEECTNLLFMMDGIELDAGRLALWRLRTHAQFGGTWLSDYLPNRLGVEETAWNGKPDCPLIGANGNIFNLMGIAARTFAENDRNDEAKEMRRRVIQCGSYDAALGVIGEYVNIVSIDEWDEPELNGMKYLTGAECIFPLRQVRAETAYVFYTEYIYPQGGSWKNGIKGNP